MIVNNFRATIASKLHIKIFISCAEVLRKLREVLLSGCNGHFKSSILRVVLIIVGNYDNSVVIIGYISRLIINHQ